MLLDFTTSASRAAGEVRRHIYSQPRTRQRVAVTKQGCRDRVGVKSSQGKEYPGRGLYEETQHHHYPQLLTMSCFASLWEKAPTLCQLPTVSCKCLRPHQTPSPWASYS